MDNYRTSLLFQCLIFLIPLNIYMWGNWLLVNVQWAFFRFQQSELGDCLVFGYQDISYIYFGQNTGIFNIAAACLWTMGSIILFVGLIITIYAYSNERSSMLKNASFFTISGGIILGVSALCRFQGGFAIPIGVPIILIIGWWIYQENSNEEEIDMESDDDLENVSDS